MSTMKAAVFVEPGRIELVSKPIPSVGPNDALVRITTTTICGTDVHILKGEYPVAKGLTVGHEPVGVIEKLGSAVTGYTEGQRVIAGAICPNFNSYAAQDGAPSQDGSYLIPQGMCGCHGFKATPKLLRDKDKSPTDTVLLTAKGGMLPVTSAPARS